ncbi:alpha/beta hydrolase [Gangjinia marincola]|uniref:Alpha/beta hydrolase n=1 Tax=Gangjinia marincola TaxID=578463 RepID=A0ABP3Y050_9FLAO
MKINIKLLRNSALVLGVLFVFGCAGKSYKNIDYLANSDIPATYKLEEEHLPSLNVFAPPKAENAPVIIFVHGGNWNSGKKETYWFLGRNFAKKDIVTVIPGYTLSPRVNCEVMAKEIAEAVHWTKENIAQYGGDPEQIYVMGHSAGGHLVALISTNPTYLKNPSEYIKGVILNDAAKLDAYSLLQIDPPTAKFDYATTWTTSPTEWKNASPIYYLDEETPTMKVYIGTETYKSILFYNKAFLEELRQYQPDAEGIYLDKKHVPMMSQFVWPWNDRYKEIVEFIESN